ncbi:MAG: type II secretion system GspH family protein [Acidobacteria bacterium]|nr:type II secretion system GspH family protein [Acidobacteriota bacterium]MCI0566565.1 type II secretion system GspH family protein [Acidobacteriota bacterium]
MIMIRIGKHEPAPGSPCPRNSGQRRDSGLSLLEVLVCIAVLLVLAGAAMPVAKTTLKRQKELELRRDLRMIREAIDLYKEYSDKGLIEKEGLDSEGYPPDLETLVEGVPQVGSTKKLKFLRRIPIDPFTHRDEWGLRSYQDDFDSKSWGRQNVYDIYTEYSGTALDGSRYEDW